MPPLSQSFSFSQFQGGAFTSSQYAQNSSSNASDALRRVTIRQLLKATQINGNVKPTFEIDGHEIRQVILVANVCREDVGLGFKITYGLDDGTGMINGSLWVNGDETDEPQFLHFAYVRVIGELNAFKTSRNLKITQIVPIDGPYEVYYHTLSVIYEAVALEKGLPPQHILRELDEVNNLSQDLAQKASTASPPPLTLDQLALTPLERDIVNCINDKSTDENIATGVHVADFIPDVIQLNPELTSEELSMVLDSLLDREILHASNSNEYYRCIL